MKKLGLIFVVFLCFSLFLVPNKTYATIGADEKNQIVTEIIEKISTVAGYDTLSVKTKDNQKGEVQRIANVYFDGVVPTTTFYSAAAEINRQFGKYLSEQTTATNLILGIPYTGGDNDTIVAEFAAINNLYIQYDSAQKVMNRSLTPEAADVRVANAEKRNTNLAKPISGTDPNSCSLFKGNLIDCAGQLLTFIIKTWVLNIAGFLVWASANMLNYAIQIGILDFKSWAPDTLYPIWIVVRQIVSLFVVFAGLYLGLMYIIGKDEKFEKYIPWVVIFALFVNFSYPLARTAIDVSNVISLNIYASAVGSNALTADITSKDTAGALIMSRLGLEGLIMSATGDTNANTSMVTSISSPAGALLAVGFVLYAAYIFFMVTALIIMRTAVLVFLTIASPILFVDSIIPKLGDLAMKLRKIFLENLFVGPVFMIMLALTLKFLQVFSVAAKTTVPGSNPTIVEFFNITMMLVMLHIMLKVTKSTAGSMGETATNWMGKVGGFAMGGATGLALGGAGILGRHTIGKRAANFANSDWLNTQAGKTGAAGFVGRRMMAMTDSVAKSSFDARNSSYVQTGAGKLGLSSGMGSGGKMGYEEVEEMRKKNLEKHLGRVGTHKNNVYENGKLIAKKGDIDTSEDAKKARDNYMKEATGKSIFTTEQERADTKYQLDQSVKSQAKAKENEELAKYRKIDEEYSKTEAEEKKKEFVNKVTDPEVKKKLAKYDDKIKEDRSRREDEKTQAEDTLTMAKKQVEVAEAQVEASKAIAKAQESSASAMNDLAAILAAKV